MSVSNIDPRALAAGNSDRFRFRRRRRDHTAQSQRTATNDRSFAMLATFSPAEWQGAEN